MFLSNKFIFLSFKFLDNSDKDPFIKLHISNNFKEYFNFLNLKSIILKDSQLNSNTI